jgi:hypothetical protein
VNTRSRDAQVLGLASAPPSFVLGPIAGSLAVGVGELAIVDPFLIGLWLWALVRGLLRSRKR